MTAFFSPTHPAVARFLPRSVGKKKKTTGVSLLSVIFRDLSLSLLALPLLTFLFSCPAVGQTTFESFSSSTHLFSGIRVTCQVSMTGRQIRILRNQTADREGASVVAPSISPVSPDTLYFDWTDPTALANRDYFYWAEALDGGTTVAEAGPVTGRRPLDVVDLTQWTQVHPAPETDLGDHTLRLLSHGGFIYLYGAGDILRRSSDGGYTWEEFQTGTATFQILMGGDDGVLLGRGSSSYDPFFRSSDAGQTWTQVSTAYPTGLPNITNYVAFGDGKWLVTYAGYVYRSTDAGVTWTNLGLKFTKNFRGIHYDGTRFIAWMEQNPFVHYSTDGNIWYGESPNPVRQQSVGWVVRKGGEYFVGPSGATPGYPAQVYRSTNLTSWTTTDLTPAQCRCFPQSTPQLAGGYYYALNSGNLVRSSNLLDWQIVDENSLYSVVHTGSRLLASGLGGYLAASPDGLNWNGITGKGNQDLLTVLRGPGGWVSVPRYGRPLFSSDGRTWQRTANLPANRQIQWRAGASSGGRYVIYGDYYYYPVAFPVTPDGTITVSWTEEQNVTETFFVSTDGLNWTEETRINQASSNAWRFNGNSGIHFHDGAFYMMSGTDRNLLETSVNGTTWNPISTGFNIPNTSSGTVESIFSFGGAHYITGNRGNFLGTPLNYINSSDEMNGVWTSVVNSSSSFRSGIRPFGGRMWSAFPDSNKILIRGSSDGVTWDVEPFTGKSFPGIGVPKWLESNGLGAFLFPVSSGNATFVTSADGGSGWFPLSPEIGSPIRSVAASPTMAIAGSGTQRLYLATLPEVSPPSITAQSGPTSVPAGEDVTLTVEASGDPVLAYQWYAGEAGDTSAPLASTTDSLTLTGVTEDTSVWVRVENEYGDADSAAIPVTVILPIPVFEVPAGSTFTSGTPVSLPLSATYSPLFSAAGLPSGLSINAATGIISGVTANTGDFEIEVTLTNGIYTGEGTFTLHILPAPPILLSPAQVPGKVGTFLRFLLAATGNPTGYSASSLPSGLSFNSAGGEISGTPLTAGTYVVTVGATNDGGTTQRAITFVVADNRTIPVISSPLQAAARQGELFQYLLGASGSPTAFALGPLPPGLTYDAQIGAIVGTPLAFGSFEIEVRANAGDLQGETTVIELFIEADPTLPQVQFPPLLPARARSGYSLQLSANPGATQFHWEAAGSGGPPPGLTLSAGGLISGTPTAAGAFPLRVWAENANGSGPKVEFELTVSAPYISAQVLAAEPLFTGRVGEGFSAQLTSTLSASTFSAVDLPPGIYLNPTDGALTGTPTVPGTYFTRFTATTGGISGPEKIQTFEISPVEDAPVITGPATWTALSGEGLAIPLQTLGDPDDFEITGLPDGLGIHLPTRQIFGVTGATGSYEITITPSREGTEGSAFTLTLTLEGAMSAPLITGPRSLSLTVGQPFSWTPSIQLSSGDTLAFVTADGLPAGISVNPDDGSLSGTPLRSGTSVVTLRPTSSYGTGSPLELRLDIAAGADAPRILNTAVIQLQQGDLVNIPLLTSAAATAYGATGLPPGLSINRMTGTIHGIAGEAGTFTVETFASNASGTGPSQTLALVIGSALGTPRVTPPVISASSGDSISVQIPSTTLPPHGLLSPLPDGYGFIAENLPAGVILDPRTGFLSGAAATPGEYTYRAAAFSPLGVGPWATGTIRITSAPSGPRITGPGHLTMREGEPTTVELQATGLTPFHRLDWSVPPGYRINSFITGSPICNVTPEKAGENYLTGQISELRQYYYTYTYRSGWSISRTYTTTSWGYFLIAAKNIPVWIDTASADSPEMTTASLHTGQVGVPFALTFTATRDPDRFILLGTSDLPAGLTFDGISIQGTPLAPGRHALHVRAVNPAGMGLTKTVEILISPADGTPAFAGFGTGTLSGLVTRDSEPSPDTEPPILKVGIYTTLSLVADGATSSALVTGLPPGLLYNATTGEISGTPSVPGTFNVTVRFENEIGPGPESTFDLQVEPADGAPGPVAATLPAATAGQPYTATLTSSGATAFHGENLPAFLHLDASTGTLAGTPDLPGTYLLTFRAANDAGASVPETTTLLVLPAAGAPVVASPSGPGGTRGVPFETFVTAAPAATAFDIGSLPPGLTFDPATGRIHGTPAVAGLHTVTARAANAAGWGDLVSFTLEISGPAGSPVLTSPGAIVIETGSPLAFQLETDVPATSYEAGDLPDGLLLDPDTGEITGTGLPPGLHTFIVRGINGTGAGSSRKITLLVGTPADVWRAGHFGAEAIIDPALKDDLWGHLADPDHDGRNNLLEYFHGTRPSESDSPATGQPVLAGEIFSWRVTHTQRPDLSVQAEFSSTLDFSDPLTGEAEIIADHGDLIEVEYRVTRPPGATRLFTRLRVVSDSE